MSAVNHSTLFTEDLPGLRCWLLVSAVLVIVGGLLFLHARDSSQQLPHSSDHSSSRPDFEIAQTATPLRSPAEWENETDKTAGLPELTQEPMDLYGEVLLQPDYSDSDSRFIDAPYAHFQQADFTRANLQSANFYHAFLGDAKFDGALLMYATLRVANLRHSHFLDADLSFSDLGDSESTGAVFNGAVLRHADASRSNLIGASFEYANMYAINLRQSWLLKASLRGAVLADAQLNHANLQHVDFTYADLSGADLSGADMRYSNITEKQLASACGSKKTVLPETLQNYTMRACP